MMVRLFKTVHECSSRHKIGSMVDISKRSNRHNMCDECIGLSSMQGAELDWRRPNTPKLKTVVFLKCVLSSCVKGEEL